MKYPTCCLSLVAVLVFGEEAERDEKDRPLEYTINIQLPVEFGVDEVFKHTISTSRVKDEDKKKTVLARFQQLELEMFEIRSQFTAVNESMTNIDHIINDRYLRKSSIPPVFDMSVGVAGYLNRLDQIQNFTIALNHRVRDLEVKQTTNPREYLQQMSIMFTDRVNVMKQDLFELMQKMSGLDDRLSDILAASRVKNQESRTNSDNVEHNRKTIEYLRKRMGTLAALLTRNNSESRHKARTVRNSVPIGLNPDVVSEDDEIWSNAFESPLEVRMYQNLTSLRNEMMRQIAGAIEVFERDLKSASDVMKDTVIKNDVTHKVAKLEKNQVYILDQVQRIALKQELEASERTFKKGANGSEGFNFDFPTEAQLLEEEVEKNKCECRTPPAIGQAIIQHQLRMDLLQTDKSTMKLELKSRKEEIELLSNEVKRLTEDRHQILQVVSEYQNEVKKLLEWRNRDESVIQEHTKRLEQHDKTISSTTDIANFTHSRLQNAKFRCAGHGKKKGSYCFSLSKDSRTWKAASLRCERQGGTLAVIKDEDTMLFITNLIRSGNYDSSFWIGLSMTDGDEDNSSGDGHSWVDNTQLLDHSYTNWNKVTQPSMGKKCVQVTGAMLNYSWYHMECEREFKYICQV